MLRLVRRPKSPNWVIRGSLRGRRVEESTRTDDKKIAEEIRARREAEILTESVYGRRATATFAQAALNYLEQGAANAISMRSFPTLGPSRSRRSIRTLSIAGHGRFIPMCGTQHEFGSSTSLYRRY